MRKELRPEHVTAVIDTREQLPWTLSPLRTVEGTLATGDYSIAGLEGLVAVERKSLPDLVACCGVERERFTRELDRLRAYPHRLLLIESTWEAIEMGQWRSRISPASVRGSLLAWMSEGLPVVLAGTREQADTMAARWLFIVARRRWRELHALSPAETGGI